MARNLWRLPESLPVGGADYKIRTDFRQVIGILRMFADPHLEDDEKLVAMIRILYVDHCGIPPELYEEAAQKAIEFIDMGMAGGNSPKPQTMDWDQDAPLIISSVNHVIGSDVRGMDMHWWTFLSAYMEIRGGVYSEVLSIRQKKSKGKKLEKEEKEFYQENRSMIDLKRRYSEREKAENDALNELIGAKVR